MRKIYLLCILAITLPTFSFSQSGIVNSGWIGSVKDIAISPTNKHISVVGENVHIFDSEKLNQVAILKDVVNPRKCLFYSDNILLILSDRGTFVYNVQSTELKPLSTEVYQCGYVDLKTNKIYLTDKYRLDIYKDLRISKSFEIKNICTSLIVTNNSIIVGCQDGEIKIFNKSDFSLKEILQGHKTAVTSLSMNKTENVLVSGAARDYQKGEFGEGITWNVAAKKILFRTNNAHRNVLSVYIDNDAVFISALQDILIYNMDGKYVKSIDTHGYSNPMFAVRNDKMIVGIADIGMTSEDLYEIPLNASLAERIFSHDSRQVWDLRFHEDKLVIIKDNEVSLLTSNGTASTYPIFSHGDNNIFKYPAQIIGISISKSELSENIFSLNLATPKEVFIPQPAEIREKRFSTDFITLNGETFAITNANLQNITRNELLIDFKIPPAKDSGLFNIINKDDFFNVRSPIRKFIVNNTELLFFEIDRENFVLNIRRASNGQYLKQISKVKRIFFQQGNTLNFLNSEGAMCSLDLSTLKVTSGEIIPNADNLYLAKYNSDRNLIAVKYDQYGSNIAIVNLKTKVSTPIRCTSMHVDCFEFSPNNKYLLTGNRYGEIEIWDVEDGKYVGLIFTGSLKKDYVLVVNQNYDGTIDGVNNFLNKKSIKNYKQEKNLLKSLLF